MTSLTALSDLTVEEVLTRWPQTAKVFNCHHMACVGCAVASFYTVAEAVGIYGLPLTDFMTQLEQAINETDTANTGIGNERT